METRHFKPVALPEPVFYPPFSITRASHYVLTVNDLDKSLAFYTGVLGMLVSDQTEQTAWLRGAEESAHHSLVLKQIDGGAQPECECIGFRVLTDVELDKAFMWAAQKNLDPGWIEVPYQSRTLRFTSAVGTPMEFCASMPVMERFMDQRRGALALAKRLDHFQELNPRIESSTAFFAQLGFRISDAIVIDGELEAVFLWRKGSVSDLVLMAGAGPRLHHAAYFVRKPDDILRACDRVGELGLPMLTCEEGPGRHGMDGAYYIYLRDPDGHRVELFDGHYQTIDAELEPKQYPPQVAAPPWGLPTLASWFQEGTPFTKKPVQEPEIKRFAPTMEDFIAAKKTAEEESSKS